MAEGPEDVCSSHEGRHLGHSNSHSWRSGALNIHPSVLPACLLPRFPQDPTPTRSPLQKLAGCQAKVGRGRVFPGGSPNSLQMGGQDSPRCGAKSEGSGETSALQRLLLCEPDNVPQPVLRFPNITTKRSYCPPPRGAEGSPAPSWAACSPARGPVPPSRKQKASCPAGSHPSHARPPAWVRTLPPKLVFL